MATSHHDATPSSASAFARAMRRCVGLLQTPAPNGIDQVPVASYPRDAESTTFNDVYDATPPLSSAAPSSDGDWNDVASHAVPMFGMVQLKAAFIWLYQLVTALVVQVAVIASDVVSLKDRITAVEGTRTPASAHGQETEALVRQVNELHERATSQEDRIAGLERSQRAETESYRKTIQELTTKLDDDRKTRDDTFGSLRQSLKTLQLSMECQGARITGVKADTARKIALLQSELAAVREELAAVKMVALPANVASAGQAAKEARKARILASVAQRMEDVEMAKEIERLCPLPPVVARSSACATVSKDMPAASTSSGGSPTTLPNYGKAKETTVKNLEITKELLTSTTARINVAQPGADKMPSKPMIPAMPTIPLPPIPMARPTTAKGSGKENKTCNRSTTTFQYTKTFQPGAGRPPDVSDKPLTASRKKAQPGAGSPSEASALPKPRKSMLPAPRKSQLPSLAKHAAGVDGSSRNEVKTANCPPGGSETRTKQLKTVKCTPIATSLPPLESPPSTLVEKEPPAGLSESDSFASLEAALQAMQDGDDILAPMPALSCADDGLSFSPINSIPMNTRRKRDDKCEGIYVPSKQRNMDVKPSRNPLKSTLAENEVSLPTRSSSTALGVASQRSQGERDVLTLLPRPDCPRVDLSLRVIPPIFFAARPHCKRESIYVSPVRTKPSRRL